MSTKLQNLKLERINKQLSSYGCDPIPNKMDSKTISKLKEQVANMKKSVMESSEFNSYHKNPDYAVALLVQEAIEIITDPEDDTPYLKVVETKTKLSDVKKLYENYVEKNGKDEKSQELLDKIIKIEKSIYESEQSTKLRQALSESAGKAQTIMSAKGLQDDMIDFQAKVGDLQNKYVDSFIAMVNDEYGADTASDIQDRLMDSLDELMKMVRKTKQDMQTIVNILSGNENTDSIVDDDPEGSLDDDELEDFGDSDEDSSDDFDIDDVLDDESKDTEEDDTEEFKRKE